MSSKYNGWLFRPFKHLWCGAVYGHKWKQASPEVCGHILLECTHCGKEKVV